MNAPTPAAAIHTPGLRADAETVIGRIRTSFAQILHSLPGDVSRPQELSAVLGVDRILGWKITRLVRCRDPFAALRYLPGSRATGTFLRAAAKKGVPELQIRDASQAIERMERLIEVHAGDRESLEMMLASWATEDVQDVEIAHRKKAFEANSFIFGLQAKASLRCYLIHSGANPDLVDVVKLMGQVGLRRLQPGAIVVLGRLGLSNADGTARQVISESLATEGEAGREFNLLPEYSSQPLPRIRAVPDQQFDQRFELDTTEVGNTAMLTVMQGNVTRACAPRYRDDRNSHGNVLARADIPCEVVVLDLVIQEGLYEASQVDTVIHGPLHRPIEPQRPCDTIRMSTTLQSLGRGVDVLHTPEFPRYTKMVKHALDRMGWDETDMTVYRLRIEYPVMSSVSMIRFALPATGGVAH